MHRTACSAFVPGERLDIAATGAGVLSGKTFGVKDLIDVEGRRTGGGNPVWRAAASGAAKHADAVRLLLAAGARCVGKTVTDELAFSLEGANAHYGTPVNPRNPDWLPGGSSSGSAVAVATGQCDFSLGTDTGGSVRAPAAFCGVYGFRPSHGAVSIEGVLPFAPSYDTVGWFARDARLLREIGETLLPAANAPAVHRVRLVEDALDHVEKAVADDMVHAGGAIATDDPVKLFNEFPLAELSATYQTVQGYEINRSLGARIAEIRPDFGASIKARFESVRRIGEGEYGEALKVRQAFARHLVRVCPADTALILPVSPVAWLTHEETEETLGEFYGRALGLNAVAGHSGAPLVQLGAASGGRGIACSLLGAPGADRALLDLTERLSGQFRSDHA
ncbi:amidase [Hoeflea sp. WL0058]|uniref:Amidase n=2 Tax=Flavimaribacter sediminis TaxID=2865987 RepID=A0AAE2ZIN3_9HYPH|nr:amidase family protein [Flavimaribacter sediminis]MBW8637188.1 amidase [Flavimaribacter sediminis]